MPKTPSLKKILKTPNQESVIDTDNAIYHQVFSFEKLSVTDDIKATLEEGIKSIAKQIINDLTHPVEWFKNNPLTL